MRRRLPAVPALVLLAVSVVPVAASAQVSGGMATPPATGGAEYGQLPPEGRPAPLRVRVFRVSPARIASGAATARLTFRVDGGARVVSLRLALTRRGRRAPARTFALRRRTGRRWTRTLRLKPGQLAPGAYVASLHVADARRRGRSLRARAARSETGLRVLAPPPEPAPPAPTPAPGPAPAPTSPPAPVPAASLPSTGHGGVFPVRGAFSFGNDGARFGASRGGREHRGQDIVAAEGTPLVAPRAGTVYWRAYQGGGAGHYLVIRGADGRDYVFMHLRDAPPLSPGTIVAAGAPIGFVGSTGSSSGPHLHFEIWPNGWYASERSLPIDPLPELRAWAGL